MKIFIFPDGRSAGNLVPRPVDLCGTLVITTVGIYSIDLGKVVTVLHGYCSTVALHPPVLSTSVH